MALFKFRWLRKFIRKRTNPIPESTAHVYKQRLSLLYAFCAWNAFGFVLFSMFRGKIDWATYHGLPKEDGTPAQQYAKMLNISKAKVVRIGAIKEEYEIDTAESDESENPMLN